ncbi:MAG: hypothetical protein R3E84_10860 [Pseudomonadales bacterium]
MAMHEPGRGFNAFCTVPTPVTSAQPMGPAISSGMAGSIFTAVRACTTTRVANDD